MRRQLHVKGNVVGHFQVVQTRYGVNILKQLVGCPRGRCEPGGECLALLSSGRQRTGKHSETDMITDGPVPGDISATTIIVMPGSFMGMPGEGGEAPSLGARTLTLRDIDRVERISGVAMATPVIRKTVEIYISGYSDSVTVTGMIPEEYTQAFATVEVTEGRFLRGSDGMSTVLGATVAHPQHLEEPIASLGGRVTLDIAGQEEKETVAFRVTGILEEVGGTLLTSVDTQIFITFTTAQRVFHTGLS